MVAAAVSGSRTIAAGVVAAVAVAYLVGMVLTGAHPVQRQLVPFKANGVLRVPPERIRRVELSRGAESVGLLRTGERLWATETGDEVGAEAGRQISMAIQVMHTSGPVRVMAAEELTGVDIAGFGLDAPQVVAKLYEAGEAPALAVRFGARNPDGFLQYMQIEGDSSVYLMSRFVGEGWTAALESIVHH
jgi:hypothetical protein